MNKLAQLVRSKNGPTIGPVGWTGPGWMPKQQKSKDFTSKPGGENQDKYNKNFTPQTQKNTGGFGTAFANARKQGLKKFTWNNKKFTTQVKGETNKTTAPKIELTDIPKPRGIETPKMNTTFATQKVNTLSNAKPVAASPVDALKNKMMAKKAEYIFEKISKKCKGKKAVKW